MTDPFPLCALDPATDAPQLLELWQSAWDAPISLRDIAFSSDSWLGCRRDGSLVGALAWGTDEQDERAQRLHALMVAPTVQRQGVATRLLHAVGLLAGPVPLSVHLPVSNEVATAFFTAQGFRPVHRWLAPEGVRMLRLQRKSPA